MALYACTNCIRQGCLWETSKRYVHNTASIADHYCVRTSPIVQITVNDLHEKFSLRSMNWWKTSFADCIMCNKQTVDSALHILFSNTCKQEATNKLKILIYIWWKWNQAISSNGIVSIAPALHATVTMEWKCGDFGQQIVLMSLRPIPKSYLEMISCIRLKQNSLYRSIYT